MVEVKEEINRIINRLPEEVLEDICLYLKELENSSKEELNFTFHLRKILTEDKNLLQRLAQ